MADRFCKDCRYVAGKDMNFATCTHSEAPRHPVTGEPLFCIAVRTLGTLGDVCGPQGRWFERKGLKERIS